MEDGMRFQRRELLRLLSSAFGSGLLLSRSEFGMAAPTATQSMLFSSPAGAAAGHGLAGGTEMEKVTGIGGLFFRAHDPKALALWYQQNLGIALIPTSHEDQPWRQEAGVTAFAPFPETTKYFDASKSWMVNFRVRDLDKMAAQLRAAGIKVEIYPQADPTGRFAHLHDPEGNPIELWQPAE
jgi:predicted enzyme related to lactoylglutathione lyase